MASTCLTPFAATIFFGFNTVVTPVSSKFHILDGSKLCFNMTSPSLLKNVFTLCRLKDDARGALVASGDLMDKDRFLFRKPVNQSALASLFLLRDWNVRPRIHGKHLLSNKVESTCCGVAVNMLLATLRVAELTASC
ncbi:unnamed protein product [Pieris macdunnoughi]|uniref:Uncharacterized protein n=1 Tax=Pieris macdunnoughi TaxID=345717 RepID=A0A821UJ23_9NEOP|nr:unnamed protein product [Pieris macdunnoughi]